MYYAVVYLDTLIYQCIVTPLISSSIFLTVSLIEETYGTVNISATILTVIIFSFHYTISFEFILKHCYVSSENISSQEKILLPKCPCQYFEILAFSLTF